MRAALLLIGSVSSGRLGLRVKWTLALLTVAILPLLVLGFIVLGIQRDGLSRAEKELEAAVVDEAASGILRSIEQASEVSARASIVFADKAIEPDAKMRIISDIVIRAPGVAGIAFFDEERHFIDAVVPKSQGEDETLKLPPEPPKSGFRIIQRADQAPILRWEAPLEGSAPTGYLVVGISKTALDKRLRDLSIDRFMAPDRVYLVDESLRVVAGPPRTVPPSLLGERRSFATTTPLVLTTEFKDGETDKVATIRTMPDQKWALIVERPTAEAFAALTSARRAFLMSVALFALIAALSGVLIVQRILDPIRSLSSLIQRYARREFAARNVVETGDELEALGSSLEHMADDLAASESEIEKRTRIETELRRYMPAEAADAAALGGELDLKLDLGGAKTPVTVLFADVVAFTGFAEKTSPEKSVALLNELFTMLSEIVFRHDGMVDKFIGDCIMAVFRPTKPDGVDDRERALAAAEDMHAFVESNLPRWREEYAFDLELGIGVAAGDVLMGNLGSASRMEYTVIGDAVNIAARLESLAQPKQTLTTKEVADACPHLGFTSLGEHALRGKAQAVEVFEVKASS